MLVMEMGSHVRGLSELIVRIDKRLQPRNVDPQRLALPAAVGTALSGNPWSAVRLISCIPSMRAEH